MHPSELHGRAGTAPTPARAPRRDLDGLAPAAHLASSTGVGVDDLDPAPTVPPDVGAGARPTSRRSGWLGPTLLLLAVLGIGAALAAWKRASLAEADAIAASQPEPMETVTVAVASERPYARTTTAIGTVLALRSITLRNELPGTVRQIDLVPGQVVEAGTVLVALDVAVEEAELAAQRAQAALTETLLGRMLRARESNGASEMEVDRARAERDVALAQIERTKAIIERKTVRAPFRARVGMADVHIGQYLDAGTELTSLQGVADAVHVDFAVPQRVAAGLGAGASVEVVIAAGAPAVTATIVAVDARVDPQTRNAAVRARLHGEHELAPGASVRVKVPVGEQHDVVTVPVSALRKSPAGDHVFVIAPGEDGKPRARLRQVESGTMLGDDVVVHSGLAAGEQVAALGSFKLHEGVLVSVAPAAAEGSGGGR
jgi:membrane fusion protein (multidrug efflux system)